MRIDQHFAVTVMSVQRRLVGRLDTQPADERCSRVSGSVNVVEILFADSRHISQRVDAKLAIRVMTRLARCEVNTRKFEAMNGKTSDFLIAESQLHRYGVKAATGQDHVCGLGHLIHIDEAQRREPLEGVIEVGYLFACELELVSRLVVDQHRAVAIQDQAAAGRNRLGADPVTLRQVGVIVVTHHLQEIETSEQGQRQYDHQRAGDQRALFEPTLLAPVVFDAAGGHASGPG